LLNTDKGAVGFILAQELASLTLPESIIFDRVSQFTAGLIWKLNKMLGIENKMSTAFYP